MTTDEETLVRRCKDCKKIEHPADGRWIALESVFERLLDETQVLWTICPICRRRRDKNTKGAIAW